ncbi:MAG: YggS family pyridoxal phosphate-dependent enzyme [Treponemataceae bacterium]
MKEKIAFIKDEIKNACIKCGRNENDVTLLAVSKFHCEQEIQTAIDNSLTIFGENRVQEACSKFPKLLEKNPNIKLHFIGSLQRNKVKHILPYASCIQSLDRFELAVEIQKKMETLNIVGKKIEVFFEFHTGEQSKSGYTQIEEIYRTLDFIKAKKSNFIIPKGFMTMAPLTQDETLIHKSFETLRNIRDEIQKNEKDFSLSQLSMGMSSDYKIAIQEGSTMVRIGTSIFGERRV